MITTKKVIERYLPELSEIKTDNELVEKIIKVADSHVYLEAIRRGVKSIEKIMLEYKKACTPEVIEMVKSMLKEVLAEMKAGTNKKRKFYAGKTFLFSDWYHDIHGVVGCLTRFGFFTEEDYEEVTGRDPFRYYSSYMRNDFQDVLESIEAITEKELVKVMIEQKDTHEYAVNDQMKHMLYTSWKKVFKTKKEVKAYLANKAEATAEVIENEEVTAEVTIEEEAIELEDTVNEIIRSAKASETNIEAYFNGNPDNAAVIFIKQLANKQAKKPIDYFTEQQLRDSYRVSEELSDLIENEPFKAYRKIVTTQSIHFQYAIIEGRIPKPEIYTTEANESITRKALRRLIHQLSN